MDVFLLVIGRAQKSAEAELVTDYLDRFQKSARAFGIRDTKMIELEARKSSASEEAKLLEKACPHPAFRVLLDERGAVLSSPEFAAKITQWRDQGPKNLVFMIGGADGFDPELRARADFTLSFGKMVWPHLLARVMLSEQLYRAATILGNKPYHRA